MVADPRHALALRDARFGARELIAGREDQRNRPPRGGKENQLTGLGLVGLNGTGDGRGTKTNVQMVVNMLERFGVPSPPTISAEKRRGGDGDSDPAALSRPGDALTSRSRPLAMPGVCKAASCSRRPSWWPTATYTWWPRDPSRSAALTCAAAVLGAAKPRRRREDRGWSHRRTSVPMELGDGSRLTWVLRKRISPRRLDGRGDKRAVWTGDEPAVDGSAVVVRVPEVLGESDPLYPSSKI